MSFNKLATLSPDLSCLEGVSALNLGFNALGIFPEVLSTMTSLRELNLDHTGRQCMLSHFCPAVTLY